MARVSGEATQSAVAGTWASCGPTVVAYAQHARSHTAASKTALHASPTVLRLHPFLDRPHRAPL